VIKFSKRAFAALRPGHHIVDAGRGRVEAGNRRPGVVIDRFSSFTSLPKSALSVVDARDDRID